eukprot:jgi/Bigna1/143294/aug1.77_g18002
MKATMATLGVWGGVKLVQGSSILSLLHAITDRASDFEDVVILPVEEPEAFVHPYNKKSWYYQMYIKTKRTVFLAVIFTPCAVLYGLAEWTNSEDWRGYWLRLLVQTESFGREIEEIFETFEEEPVASGTVAQVHRATWKREYAMDGKV